MKYAAKTAIITAALLFSTPSLAWDGVLSGPITEVDVVSEGENFGFRVFVGSGQVACAGSTLTWSYINRSANNYDAIVSLINSYFLSGKNIAIYTTNVSNYCRIDYIQAQR